MTRRRWLLLLVVLSGASVVSTSAAPVGPSWQDEAVEGRIALAPAEGPHGQYAVQDEDGELAVVIGPETLDRGRGLVQSARFWFDEVFVVQNTGDGAETVWLTGGGDSVQFYRGSFPGEPFEGAENSVTLESGGEVPVGVRITTGATTDDIRTSFTVHTEDGETERLGGGLQFQSADDGEETATAQPELRVINASLNRTEVTPGGAVAVSATIENTGDGDGKAALRLFVDGTYAGASRLVHVPAGSTEQVTLFHHRFREVGTHNVTVDDEPAGTVDVRPAPTTTATATPTTTPSPTATQPTATSGSTTATGGSPALQTAAGFPLWPIGLLLAMLVLLGSAAVARNREWV